VLGFACNHMYACELFYTDGVEASDLLNPLGTRFVDKCALV
jgi:hypothetical protein